MAMSPKVSVIIPVYNTEKYLRQCLDSVANQTLREIEIICVDDGSTDSSLEILHEYASKDERVKIIMQQNQHAGVARNNGMKMATGEYFVFLDADDFFEPDMLEKEYRQCKKYDADICLCGFDRYDTNNAKVHSPTIPFRIHNQPFNIYTIPNIFQITYTSPWTKVFSARFIRQEGLQFQDLVRSNDVYFVCAALALAKRIVCIDDLLVHYRVGQTTNLQAKNYQTPDAFLIALVAVKELLVKKGIYAQVEKSFMTSILTHIRYNLSTLEGRPAYQELLERIVLQYWDYFSIHHIKKEDSLNLYAYNQVMPILLAARKEYSPVFVQSNRAFATKGVLPKVSVIVPVYNVEEYLRECMDSIANQTLTDIEIICVNDGSIDSSLAIVQEYAARDERITVISQKNGGLSAARNSGLAAAQGEYVYFIDSDDYLRQDALEKLYNRSQELRLDILFFDMERFYDEESLKKIIPPVNAMVRNYPDVYTGADFYRMQHSDHCYVCSACVLFANRSFLQSRQLRFYEGIVHEDELFTFLALMEAERVSHIPEDFYLRRYRSGSIMCVPKSHKNVIGYFTCMQEIMRYGLSGEHNPAVCTELVRGMNAMRVGARFVYEQLPTAEQKKVCFDNPISQTLFDTYICNGAKHAENRLSQTNNSCPKHSPAKHRIRNLVSRGIGNYREFGFVYTVKQAFFLTGKLIKRFFAALGRFLIKFCRFWPWLFRNIPGGIRCCREHGLRHTVKLVLTYLRLVKNDR